MWKGWPKGKEGSEKTSRHEFSKAAGDDVPDVPDHVFEAMIDHAIEHSEALKRGKVPPSPPKWNPDKFN